jgi:hypothetical protein
MGVQELRELRQLRDENSRLKRLVADLSLDRQIVQDLLSHGLLEMIPNALSHGLTEPTVAYALRWMAGKRAGLSPFNPLYTVE